MYPVRFVTNRDCQKPGGWNFPSKVLSIPLIGDHVRSANGETLKVQSITHTQDMSENPVIEIYVTNF